MMFTATFVSPNGLPIQPKDGMYEVRVFDIAATNLIERLLADHGLTIAARDEHLVQAAGER